MTPLHELLVMNRDTPLPPGKPPELDYKGCRNMETKSWLQ